MFPFLVSKNSCCSFVFFGFCWLRCFFIPVPWVARDDRVHCSRAPLATIRLCETGFARCQSSHFMASNLPPQMLLEPFATVIYTLDSGIRHVPFKQAHLLSGVVIHYARTVLCAKKWMACAWNCTIAQLGWWGHVQNQPHTKVPPLPYPLSPYYYYYYYYWYYSQDHRTYDVSLVIQNSAILSVTCAKRGSRSV